MVVFQVALKMNPLMPELVSNLASALNDLGRHVEAAAICEDALNSKPDLAAARANLANAMLGLGKHEKAMENYRLAVQGDPGNANAWFSMGNALFEMGQGEEALKHYQEAVRLSPESAEKHYNLANAALDHRKPTKPGASNAIVFVQCIVVCHSRAGRSACRCVTVSDKATPCSVAHAAWRRSWSFLPAQTILQITSCQSDRNVEATLKPHPTEIAHGVSAWPHSRPPDLRKGHAE